MSNQNTDNEKLKELADRIKADELEDEVKKKDGAFEFSFTSTLPKTALIFEEGEGDAADDEEEFDAFAVENSESHEAEEKPESELPREKSIDDEEFDIPDMFVVSDEYNELISDDNDAMIWKTYVPRFTEVTERQYRLRDENATTPRQEPERKTTVSVSQLDSEEVSEDSFASSSERLDEENASAVIVNVNSTKREYSDTINFFKFSDEKKEKSEGPSEEEIEKARISALTGHKWREPEEQEPQGDTSIPYVEDDEEISEYEPITRKEEPTLSEAYAAREDNIREEEKPRGASVRETEINAKSTSEYNSFSMREFFKDRFLDTLLSSKIRIAIAAIIAFAVLVFENAELVFPGSLAFLGIGANLALPALFDLCLVVGSSFVVLPEIVKALRALIRKSVAPELSLCVSCLSIVAYDLVMIFNPTSRYPLFGFVWSAMVLCSIYATYCLHSANFESFKTISEKEEKHIVDIEQTRLLERENIALDGAVDEYKSRISRVFKTNFVSDFFGRSASTSENTGNNLLVIAFSLGIAAVASVITFFLADGLTSAAATFALTVTLSLPVFSILSHKLPFYHAELECAKNKSAVVGEASLGEYSMVDVVSFRDTEIFGEDDVVFKSISLSDREGDFRQAMKKMSSLFSAVGGPLDRMFAASVGKRYSQATSVVIEDSGVCGLVDGKIIAAGTADYMRSRGIVVPRETSVNIESTRIMYAAEEGALFAKFAIQYSFSESFAMSLPELRENKIVPLVYTKDPNITSELMRFLTGQDAIRVMREYSVADGGEKIYRRLSSGLVTKKGKDEAISLILLSKRYDRLQKQLSLTELSAAATGAALAVAIAMCNMTASLPSVLIGVWQIAWCVALGFISRHSFDFGKKRKRKG